MTGVRIVRVVQKLCAGLDCPLHFCDELVSLDKGAMSTYSTARLSFVTPRHQRTATCQCEGAQASRTCRRTGRLSGTQPLCDCIWSLGGRCPVLNNLCENNPCPEGMECVSAPRDAAYSCVCPEAKKGKCSGKTASTDAFTLHTTVDNTTMSVIRWPRADVQRQWLREVSPDGEREQGVDETVSAAPDLLQPRYGHVCEGDGLQHPGGVYTRPLALG